MFKILITLVVFTFLMQLKAIPVEEDEGKYIPKSLIYRRKVNESKTNTTNYVPLAINDNKVYSSSQFPQPERESSQRNRIIIIPVPTNSTKIVKGVGKFLKYILIGCGILVVGCVGCLCNLCSKNEGDGLGITLTPVNTLWKNRGQVVFLGDSITHFFDIIGATTWNAFYAPVGAINAGVSADGTSQTIDRINNGMIDNLNAYLAVLKIGTNDLARRVDETTVVKNIGIIIELIKKKNPGVKVLLLGILPRDGPSIHQQIQNVNALIANYYDGESVFFMNMEAQFSDGLGTVKPGLFIDGLHLTGQGYAVWAQTMNPLFDIIINKPFPAKAVWLGDSLTYLWNTTGLPVWDEFYAPIESVNFGTWRHTTTQTIDRIEKEGILDGLNSKVAVLMVGLNDIQDGVETSKIIANIQRIIELIQIKLPHGRIILMALLPAEGRSDFFYEQKRLVNNGLAAMENGDDVRFLDMQTKFADGNENIFEELYQEDKTHLSLEGYKVWQQTMDPIFKKLIKF